MDTKQIVDLVLKMASLDELPADSGVIVPGENISRVFVGIDMATPELMLAKELGADLVFSHHPQTGEPEIFFHRVMERQIDKMVEVGVPINKAQKALREQICKIERAHHSGNYDRVGSAARLLKMPYINIHLPVDIITEKLLQQKLDAALKNKSKPIVQDILEIMVEIPEYKKSLTKPIARVGGDKDFAGKVLVLMAGGTNGGEQVFKAYFEAGIGTIVCMHLPEDVRLAVLNQNIGNVIVAGHMASDSIGMNLVCNAFEGVGLEVVRMGGIIE